MCSILMLVVLSVVCSRAVCQLTGGLQSVCTFTFHVPKQYSWEVCPSQADNQDDDVITKAQMVALISNQQVQMKLLTENMLRVTADNQQIASELIEVKLNMTANLQQVMADNQQITTDLLQVKDQLAESRNSSSVNYIRWGRTECSDTADKLYEGYAAKSYYNHAGGGSDYLCLHNDPQWPEGGAAGMQYASFIYPVEYQAIVGKADLSSHDAPCVSCVVTARSQMIMIPGRLNCSTGWTREYYGALAAEHRLERKSSYVCLDSNPESIPGSAADRYSGNLYTVEAACDQPALCPPYTHGQEIACVVCTK